jgi:ubiquinone/menaquinone biosynthesis C-methylase UbiE
MEEVRCNICEKADNEFVLTVPDCADPSLSYELVRCRKCDLTFVSPRPKGVDMHKYYPDNTYYAYQNNQIKGVGQKLKQKLKTYLMEWAGGYRPPNDLIEKRTVLGSIFWSVIKNYLIGVVPSTFLGKLLDVGCGNGELMIWYQRHGWETVGIEPSARGAMIARARGLKIIESTIEEANLPDDYFDAITMVQVLEHLEDPKGALRKLYRVLRPGGLIVAGVPNFLCLDRQVMGSNWLPLETPRHLYYFTPKSLQTIFKAIGFNTLQIRKKTIYGVTLSQIKESCRLKSVYKRAGNITYIVGSPFIKLLAPKDYSSTFISIYARK